MAKISMRELLEDREAGSNHLSQGLASSVRQYEADLRRKRRLPDLENAFIEAVKVLKELSSGVGSPPKIEKVRKFLGDVL